MFVGFRRFWVTQWSLTTSHYSQSHLVFKRQTALQLVSTDLHTHTWNISITHTHSAKMTNRLQKTVTLSSCLLRNDADCFQPPTYLIPALVFFADLHQVQYVNTHTHTHTHKYINTCTNIQSQRFNEASQEQIKLYLILTFCFTPTHLFVTQVEKPACSLWCCVNKCVEFTSD